VDGRVTVAACQGLADPETVMSDADRRRELRRAQTFPLLADHAWLRERYVDQGRSARLIAAEVGCSQSTVFAALHAAGIPSRAPGPSVTYPLLADAGWLAARRDQGRTLAQIAAEVGCDTSAVRHAVARHQIA
jgi:hypothetical protein